MSKWASLPTMKQAPLASFVFFPPDQALKAARIMVLANLGFAVGAPAALNWGTLAAVLRGLRRASPRARILLVDRICPSSAAENIFERIGLGAALDEEMRAVSSDILLRRDYANPLAKPLHHALFSAPTALAEFDCVVNVAVYDPTAAGQGCIAALAHVLPCDFPLQLPDTPQRYHDLYFTFAACVQANVLEVRVSRDDTRVLSSTDMLALDESAARLTGHAAPDYIEAIRHTQRANLPG